MTETTKVVDVLLPLGKKHQHLVQGHCVGYITHFSYCSYLLLATYYPRFARMTLLGWISSHRCSWMVVYILCCNAHSNLIVFIMSCIGIVMHSLFVNCPDVIRLPSKLSIFHGEDTNLVNCGPWSILLQFFNIYCKVCFLYLLQTTTFHTIRLILCVQQDR